MDFTGRESILPHHLIQKELKNVLLLTFSYIVLIYVNTLLWKYPDGYRNIAKKDTPVTKPVKCPGFSYGIQPLVTDEYLKLFTKKGAGAAGATDPSLLATKKC
jgi:hypothetical protein